MGLTNFLSLIYTWLVASGTVVFVPVCVPVPEFEDEDEDEDER